MDEQIGAMMQGMQQGRIPLSGMAPTAASPRGGRPAVDPLTGRFRAAVAELMSLSDALKKENDAKHRELDVEDMGIKLQRMMIDRQEDIANAGGGDDLGGDNAMQTQFPNVNAGGTV